MVLGEQSGQNGFEVCWGPRRLWSVMQPQGWRLCADAATQERGPGLPMHHCEMRAEDPRAPCPSCHTNSIAPHTREGHEERNE